MGEQTRGDVRRILVAARGALGRTLIARYRARGIESVAAFAEADAETPYVEEADFDAFLGAGPAPVRWADPVHLIELAMDAGCDAIHPGRGPTAGAVALYATAATANVLVIGLDPRRAVEALEPARILARARGAGLAVPPAEGVGPDDDGIAAAARVGVPLRVLGAGGGREARVDGYDALPSALAEVRGAGQGAVLVHDVPGDETLDVVVVGDAGEVVPLGVIATSGGIARYPSDAGADLVAPVARLCGEIGLQGVATVRFRLAADGSAWWWGLRPVQPPAAALVEAVQGVDLVQAELATATGQSLGWAAGDAAEAERCGLAALVSRTGPGEVTGLVRAPGDAGSRWAVEVGSALPEGAARLLAELVAVAPRGAPDEAAAALRSALLATRIDGVPSDLAELAAASADARGALRPALAALSPAGRSRSARGRPSCRARPAEAQSRAASTGGAMPGYRPARVAEMIHRELAERLRSDVKDPRVEPISITSVDVTRDLSRATIAFMPLGGGQPSDDLREGLAAAARQLRGPIGRALRLRHAPELVFDYDDRTDAAFRVTKLLDRLAAERGDAAPAGGDDEDVEDEDEDDDEDLEDEDVGEETP
ncbi:MAG: 30S ribosome-binding factor RbfA [Myxococcota bacterium]